MALHLVGDLPGTGSKISQLGVSGTPHAQVLLPLRARSPTRWSATPAASHALRAEAVWRVLQYRSFVAYRASELSPNIVGARLPAIAVGQSTSM